jgi:hypothetical protein
MATLFPLDPEINELYQGYYWDGNFWKKSGQDAGFGYLEESALQNTYLSQVSASTIYATQTDLDNIDLSLYLTQSSASTQYEKLIPYSSSAPLSPATGDLWLDSLTSPPALKTYNGSSWVQLGSAVDDAQAIFSSRMFS